MSRVKNLPELEVLHQKNVDAGEDEWPIFTLHNTEVRSANGSLTSLLKANPKYPVTFSGELMFKGAAREVKTAILPSHRNLRTPVPVIVKNCTYFAYGAFENGDIAIWAAGQAGWHQIHPAESYIEIFQEMTEAVSALYYLIDSHANGQKPEAKDIFQNYAKIHKMSYDEAAQRFYSHADFLASRMMKKEEDISWNQKPFYKHLRNTRPGAFGSASKPAANVPIPATTQTTRASVTRSQTRDTKSRSQTRDTKPRSQSQDMRSGQVPPKKTSRAVEPEKSKVTLRKASSSSARQSVPPLLSDANKAKAKEIWRFIQRKTNETLPETGEMTIETFARFLFQSYQIQDEKEAQNLLKYLAPDLVALMTIPRGRSYDPWTELPIYDELLEAKVPLRIKSKLSHLKLEKRERPLPEESEDTGASETDSELSVMDAREATIRKREDARRRISSLRLKSGGQYSGKAVKWKGKAKAVDDGSDEEMLDDAVANESENANEDAMSVDTPSKRKGLSEDEDELVLPEYPNKRFTRSQGDQDPELEDLEFEIQQAKSTGLAIRRKASIPAVTGTTNGQAKPTLGLVSEFAPSTDANAPGDVWNCPHNGCVHKVYGASERESKELIRDHMLDHKENDRVGLIRNEQNMTQLPVSHLLKKIREMAERNETDLQVLDNGLTAFFPPPLERLI